MIARRPLASQIVGLKCDYLGGKGKRQNREKRWLEGDERVRVMEVQLVGLGRVSYFFLDRKSTRLNSSHPRKSRMPSSA